MAEDGTSRWRQFDARTRIEGRWRRTRRAIGLACVAAVATSAWLACVGEDPSPASGPLSGDRLGPCFPDKTCKQGLECRDGEICLKPDEPKPVPDGGTADGGVGDGSPPDDAANTGDATIACPVGPPPPASSGPDCPYANKRCAAEESCCVNDAQCRSRGECIGTGAWDCDTSRQCPTGEVCCANLTPQAKQCPTVEEYSASMATCSPSPPGCTGGGETTELCDTGCDGGQCIAVRVHRGPYVVVLGRCVR